MPKTILESFLEDMLPLEYLTVVSLAFTLYDHILTFDVEVRVVTHLSKNPIYMLA